MNHVLSLKQISDSAQNSTPLNVAVVVANMIHL